MAWDEGKFNAALANKLRNQDIHAQVEGFNATTNRINAGTQADLLPSQQATHLAAAQAGLMNAGTTRAQLAAANPQGFSQTQIGGFGLRGMPGPTGAGFTAAGTGQPNSIAGMQQAWDARQAKDAANPGPGMPVATTYGDITGQKPPGLLSDQAYPNGARGGPMGDVEHDTGRDTQHAMVRPGEYMVDPNAVGKAFGGGDYHQGVRNLNRIIHDATGYEPGATYAKKGKAGFARSGLAGARRPIVGPFDSWPDENPRDLIMKRGMPGYKDSGEVKGKKKRVAAPVPAPAAPVASPWASTAAGLNPRDAALAEFSNFARENPSAQAAEAQHVMNPNRLRAMYERGTAAGLTDADRLGAIQASYGPQPLEVPHVAPANTRPGGLYAPPTADEILKRQAAANGVAVPSNLPGATPSSTPMAAALTGVRGKYDMSEDVGTSARKTPIPQWAPRPQHIMEANNFAIRDKIQSQGKPGETFSLDYGAGYGMGPTKPPIYATADKSGKFNMFSDRAPVPTAPAQAAAPNLRAIPAAAPRAPLPPLPPGMAPPMSQAAKDTLWAEENVNKFPQLAHGGQVPEAGDGPRTTVLKAPAEPRFWNPDSPPVSEQLGRLVRSALPSPSFYDKGENRQRGLRMAKGGQVPGFVHSGWMGGLDNDPWRPQASGGMGEYGPSSTPHDPMGEYGPNQSTSAQMQADEAARLREAQAEARRTGTSWRDAYERLKARGAEPVGPAIKEGLKSAVEAVKPYVPSAGTIGKVADFGARKVALPFAIGADIAGAVDVATDPRTKGWETVGNVATDVAGKGLNWGGASAGAIGGGMLGAATGPFAPVAAPVGALLGGIAGYAGVDWGQGKAREILGGSKELPSETSQGAYKKLMGIGQPPGEAAADPRVTDFQKRGAAWAANERKEEAARAQGGGQGQGAVARPGLRDILMMRALGYGGPGTGGADEQRNIFNYLAAGERGGSSDATSAARAQELHEKEIEASLLPQFDTTVVGKDGKTEKVSHPELFEKFAADLASRDLNVYQMSRKDRDKALAAWKSLHRADERANQIVTGSGDPNQPLSDRIQPMGLRPGGMGFGDWWGNPNIGIGDYGRSFIGKGLQNRVAVRDTIDPTTGRPIKQLFPAAKVFGDEQGQDLDALRYTQGQ